MLLLHMIEYFAAIAIMKMHNVVIVLAVGELHLLPPEVLEH